MKNEYEDYQEELPMQEGQIDLTMISPKSGVTTSQGQLTIWFGIIAAILSAVGFATSPEQVENWYAMIQNLITILGPLLAYVPVLITYINSRGKIQSNNLWANAAIASGLNNKAEVMQLAGINDGRLGDIIGGITKGIKIGGALGIPKLGKVGKIIDEVGEGLNSGSTRSISDEELREALERLGQNDEILYEKLNSILAQIDSKLT